MRANSLPKSLKEKALYGLLWLAFLLLIIASFTSYSQTTITNLDFNTSPYSGTLNGITATPTGYGANFTGTTGGCYVNNTNAGSTIATNNGNGTMTMTLTGATLSNYGSFTGCFQAQRSNTGPPTLTITYSVNGGAYQAASSSGSPGNGSFGSISFTLPVGANNPTTSLAIRIAGTGASGGSGTLRLDNLQVRATAGASITTGTVTPAGPYCNNQSSAVSVPFTFSGTSGTYTAQLSNASGSFASPTTIGSGLASPVFATIPSGLTAGTGYKIRVVNGSTIGTESSALIIQGPVSITGQPDPQTLCAGSPIALAVNVSPSGTYTYKWYRGTTLVQSNTNNTYVKTNAQVADGGNYRVEIVSGSCTTVSNTVAVNVETSPSVTISASPGEICATLYYRYEPE